LKREGCQVFQQKLRKVGNSYVVTVPREEVTRLGLREGQLVLISLHPLEVRPALPHDIRDAAERSWARSEAAYRYLADR
jgi:antitoxin component of MazEF toxin-antitoxin module